MAKRLVHNGNTSSEFEYAENEAYLNVALEYDDGTTEPLNYYQDPRTGDFVPVGIKLFREIEQHAMLMDLFDNEDAGVEAQDLVVRLRLSYFKRGNKTDKKIERKLTLGK
ncbi:hypothetical protein ACN94T_002586 [Acinetobacter baumannii]|nr:hypothetical protein [Acinetobacter baumannii]EKU8237871.1 hypothetical protein [Acinetobacter baumannii]EKU8309796.1 hypothetical protein [Acinetobacter baumannii]EKU8413580.1 hypothetical protein [Acinetobacter baumannii]EKU9263370.1 hypothetical protein [Acinetobacter baumannii]